MNTIIKLLLSAQSRKKLSKERIDYLLGALALSALSGQASAQSNEKGNLINAAELAKEIGVEVSDISKVMLTLSDTSSGELISLGNGIYQFIPAKGVDSALFVVSGSGVEHSFTSNFEVTGNVENFDFSLDNLIKSLDFSNTVDKSESSTTDNSVSDKIENFFSDLRSELASKNADKIDVDASDSSFGHALSNFFDVDASDSSFGHALSNFFDEFNSDVDDISSADVNYSYVIPGVGLAVLALASGGSSVAAEILQVLSGVASHGTLENARVFLDLDGDSVWDSNEIFDITDSQGQYDLEGISAADQANGTLVVRALTTEDNVEVDGVVVSTVDTISGSSVQNIVMKAESSATVITPLTTLVEAGVSNEDVIDILGLGSTNIDINTYNPFSIENDGTANAIAFEKVASQIFTTVNTVAEAIDAAAGDDVTADQVFLLAVAEVVKKVETEVQIRAENVVLQEAADILTAEKVSLELEETALKAEEVILIAARDSAEGAEAASARCQDR